MTGATLRRGRAPHAADRAASAETRCTGSADERSVAGGPLLDPPSDARLRPAPRVRVSVLARAGGRVRAGRRRRRRHAARHQRRRRARRRSAPACTHTCADGAVDDCVLESRRATSLPLDERLLPAGEPAPVAGTELDFRRARAIGAQRIDPCFGDLDRDSRRESRACALWRPAGRSRRSGWTQRFRFVQIYTADDVPDPRAAARGRDRADDVRSRRVQLRRRARCPRARRLLHRPLRPGRSGPLANGPSHNKGVHADAASPLHATPGRALCPAVAAAPAAAKPKHGPGHGLSISKSDFGSVDGTAVEKYTLDQRTRHVGLDPHLRRHHPVAVGS